MEIKLLMALSINILMLKNFYKEAVGNFLLSAADKQQRRRFLKIASLMNTVSLCLIGRQSGLT